MIIAQRLRRGMLKRLLPQPVSARHAEYSMIFSADDDGAPASPRLMSVAMEAIQHARSLSLAPVTARMPAPPYYPEVWPGEIYKLLAGLVQVMQPRSVVEVGTGVGTSTLAMKAFMPDDATLLTFDILGWRDYEGSLLREEDFQDGRLRQSTEDLNDPAVFAKHRDAFAGADLIYLDGPKDGLMEPRLLDRFATLKFSNAPLIAFDDIRVWNMLKTWRLIRRPKLDLTSFGHWTGTGLVEWGAL